jgi:biopolymer transport protein ExbD
MPLKMHQDPLPEMNLTPMIDIVFNLIIFFMVGTKFAEMDRSVELHVPKVAAAKNLSQTTASRVVEVHRDGSIRLGKRVMVRGDAEGSFQHVASVLTACRDAGVKDLGIAVETAGKTVR